MTKNMKYSPVDLECGHRLWFLSRFRPRKKESLWCRSCRAYQKGIKAVADEGSVTWDGYVTTPHGNEFVVECNYEPDCEWQRNARSYADAENLAFRHISIDHSHSSLLNVLPFKQKKPILDEPGF